MKYLLQVGFYTHMWSKIKQQALDIKPQDGFSFNLNQGVLSCSSIEPAMAQIIAISLDMNNKYGINIYSILLELLLSNPLIVDEIQQDLAENVKNTFIYNELVGFLSSKGFHALVIYRITHHLWQEKKYDLAILLSNLSSQMTLIEIHPAALIASPISIDHGSGIVIGETAKIEKHVVLFQAVTLGSRLLTDQRFAKFSRHPFVREGAILGAGATLIGPIEIGAYAFIGAGSVVIRDVEPLSIVVGNPAKVIGSMKNRQTSWSANT